MSALLASREWNNETWSSLGGERLCVVCEEILTNSLFGGCLFKKQSNEYMMMTEVIMLF